MSPRFAVATAPRHRSAPATTASVAKASVADRSAVPVLIRLAALAALGASLSGCLGYDGSVQHGYVIDQQVINDVKQGQTAEQVLVTLGSPSTTSTVGGDAWYYISSRTDRSIAFMQPTITDRKVMAVYFDKGKKVTRIATYGMQDGKVVDFASATTPTFGSDASFIKSLFFNFNPLGGMIPKS